MKQQGNRPDAQQRIGEDADSEVMARRNLLRLGGMAAAGVAGAAFITAVDASPAAAGVDGDVVLNLANNAATGTTGISASLNQADVGRFLNGAGLGAGVHGRCGIDSGNFPTDVANHTVGVYGETGTANGYGVMGTSTGAGGIGVLGGGFNIGVWGVTPDGTGVRGDSTTGVGVQGFSVAAFQAAVSGSNNGSLPAGQAVGVQGVVSSDGYGVSGSAGEGDVGAGVLGAHQGAGAGVRGIDGDIYQCVGVEGLLTNTDNPRAALHGSTAGTGPALLAEQKNASANTSAAHATAAGTGPALLAEQTNGSAAASAVVATAAGTSPAISATTTNPAITQPAILCTSAGTAAALKTVGRVVPAGGAVALAGNGKALAANGIVAFSRTGAATITAGQVSPALPIPVAGGLAATSYVLATIQTAGAGSVAVASAVPNPATGKITITLTANAPVTLTVAWFVFG